MTHTRRQLGAAAVAAAGAGLGAAASWHWSRRIEVGGEKPAQATPPTPAIELPDPPPGGHRVLPPDAIPAVDSPTFVSGDQVGVGSETQMIFLEGRNEAKAYSLRLLNGHEVVNDTLDGEPIAVTW